MFKITIFIILLISKLSSNIIGEMETSFITKAEYGKALYENPRGIGCHKCHGKNAEGKFIASYAHIPKKSNDKLAYTISAPNIKNIDFQLFKKTINNLPLSKLDKQRLNREKNHISIMPKYFLTDEELLSIHYYINNIDSN